MSSINSKVPPLRLMAVDTPSDGEVAAYQSSSGKFEWVASGGGFTSFTVAGDAGVSQTITDGDTLTLQGSGGVTKVTMSATDTATISLENTAVTAGSYTNADITVDAQGRITSASNGSGTSPGGSDGDFQINNSGSFGGSILSTNKTTTITLNSGASGDPQISMTSNTKSITLLCDTNQKLKVEGGVNSFVFDASSATGGITWPDGTTQTSASTATIGGSIANTQVAYGSGTDTIQGSANLTFDGTNLDVAGYVKSGTGIYDTNGATDLTLQTNGGTNSGTIIIRDGAAQDIEITPDTSGVINLDGLKWPTADGTANQVLATDGAGTLSFTDAGGGGGSAYPPTIATSMQSAYDTIIVTALPPNSNNVLSVSTQTIDDNIYFFPFILGTDITALNMQISVNNATASTSLKLGIYNADSTTGSPSTLITNSTTTIDVSTTSYKTGTLAASTSLSKNTLYYIGMCCDVNSCGLRSHSSQSTNGITGLTQGISTYNRSILYDGTTTGSLPSSVTTTNLLTKYGFVPLVGVEI